MPRPTGAGAFFQSSNGLASGNHRLEAISHAICEVVERDASSLWHASNDEVRRERRLDLDTVHDADCGKILSQYESAGVAVAVWETTTDLGLPSFDCVIVEEAPNWLRPLPAAFGAGCHPAREIALMRALTEAAQSRLTSISGSRDDMDRPGHERSHDHRTIRAVTDLVRGNDGRRSFHEVPTTAANSFEEDLEMELACLAGAGVEEVVVVDLSRPEFEIPVVKVVIPGLEAPHRISGYVPGARAHACADVGSSAASSDPTSTRRRLDSHGSPHDE